jgi:3-oxoacyl-[acyl-carrier-protein] synthase III
VTKAALIGIGSSLPPDRVTNDDLAQTLDTSDEWIARRTGIRERRRINGSQTLTDLAVEASERALIDAGISGADIDHVLCSTVQADYITPGLAPMVAHRIGAVHAGGIDTNAACAGFLYSLDQAAAMIETGRAQRVLVVGAEALSRITNQADRSTAVLFADGAGAGIVVAGDFERGLAGFHLGCSGEYGLALYAGIDDDRFLHMEGTEVYRHAVARMVESTRAIMQREGMTADDIDLFVAHQANARIIESVANELGFDMAKVFINVDRVANTSSASIPLALTQADAEGRLKPGDTVALAAFGAGFAWGAGVMTWKEQPRVPA